LFIRTRVKRSALISVTLYGFGTRNRTASLSRPTTDHRYSFLLIFKCPIRDLLITIHYIVHLFLGDGFTNTTITWLTWMPHIRILNIDNEILLQLGVNKVTIDRFLSLEVLIVRQTNKVVIDEPLTIITRLGMSSSLRTIHLQQYRTNLQVTTDDLLLVIHQICHNMCGLKVMIIEFDTNALFNNETLEKFTDIQKKNCRLEYIHVSSAYIELWFRQ
jgi:hypothetical protein